MFMKFVLCFWASSWFASSTDGLRTDRTFPEDFKFGIATASYQIEGAWNVSETRFVLLEHFRSLGDLSEIENVLTGRNASELLHDKSEQIWDHYTHTQPHKIKDRSNGDVACDSYHLYKRDIEMLRELGVDFYRFSISWSRLLPKGYGSEVSQDGLRYYNNLIDDLVKYNITPMVTLFHWDTPQLFMEMGGWTNPLIVDFFEDYVKVVFKHFGDRVKHWFTFNEAYNMCWIGYGSRRGLVRFAPDMNFHGFGEYLCTHNVLKAHAAAYHIYNNTFKAEQKGKMGMATLILWAEPETNSTEDQAIAEKALQFTTGWYYHPILTKEGDYPPIMRSEIDRISKEQGFKHSRLPYFTPEEVEQLKGTADFIGVNFYTSVVYKNDKERPTRDMPSYENDMGHIYYQPSDWPSGTSSWLKLRPHTLRQTLNWVKKTYGDMEIYITEIGYSSDKKLNDNDRVDFINDHASAVLDALDDGVNVTHFTLWSLMDNFEWSSGYTEAFGVYYVDFDSPNKTRTPRMSALAYRELIRTKRIQPDYRPEMVEIEKIEYDNNNYTLWIIFPILIIVPFVLIVLILAMKHLSKNKKKLKEDAARQTIVIDRF